MRRPILLVIAILALAGGALAWWVMKEEPLDCCAPPGKNLALPEEPPLPALAGRTILAGCRQGECSWMRIGEVTRAVTVPQGELRRMIVERGSSVHLDGNLPERAEGTQIEWEAGTRSDYAFCSIERPAYAFEDEGGLITHYLDLYDLAGYQTSSGRLYMRLCHDVDEEVPDAATLGRFGYRPGTRSEQIEGATPEDMTRF
ncbi:MAG: hypothetical protein KF780_06180 [Sphingomonas sp.]|nr:hypothetical protein [Sphingomonas sp.]